MYNNSLILQVEYIPANKYNTMLDMVCKNEAAKENGHSDLIDQKVLPNVKWLRKEDYRTTWSKAICDANTGLYNTIYIVHSSPFESNAFRENTMDRDDPFAIRSAKERIDDEVHFMDELIQTVPMIDKADDRTDYWFVAKTNPEIVDVVRIDLACDVPRMWSITKEFYAPVAHDTGLTDHERAWATVLGYEGEARKGIRELMEKFDTEEELLAFANGMTVDELGTTSDAQIVICPKCGEPTFASPNQHAYTDKVPVDIYSDEEAMQSFLTPTQMTCSHCGADLTSCFDFDEPAEKETVKVSRPAVTGYSAWWTDSDYNQVHFK